ncbi:hypothetical protein ACRQ5D_13255 [Mucilaginibacter sp. P25]|uniref:Uncharacterized protein n=1 Tax=Mucilaginibacter gossypii TaxID=551996 RepID=A0A1G8ISL3_9SPHI|nr:hypothetical protein [Mucilaginibacter gossypii]SDI21460.1 hypothetical protein SAMN05192573_11783 [Mucilaginibacter gossypii]
MKKYFTCILIATALLGCKKTDIVSEVIKGSTGTNTGTNTDISTGTTTASIKLDIADQVVNTKVSNDTLYLNYTETANLVLNPDDYQKSSAVHFKEDFSKSNLANFNFTAVNKDNQTATNYLDDNLNNVAIKSASTLTIDGKQYTKLVLERAIVFSKAYKQHDLAVEAQNDILKQTKDVISFATYYYTNGKNSDTISTTATVVYRK